MQHRPSPSSWFLTVAFVAGFAVLGVAGNQPVPPDPEDPALREIIDRALERAALPRSNATRMAAM